MLCYTITSGCLASSPSLVIQHKHSIWHHGGEYGHTVRNSLSNPVCRVQRLERVRWEQRRVENNIFVAAKVKGKDWLMTSKLVILVGVTHNSENNKYRIIRCNRNYVARNNAKRNQCELNLRCHWLKNNNNSNDFNIQRTNIGRFKIRH